MRSFFFFFSSFFFFFSFSFFFFFSSSSFLLLLLLPLRPAGCVAQVRGGYRLGVPPNCPEVVFDSLEKCWHSSARDRPDFIWLRAEFDHQASHLPS